MKKLVLWLMLLRTGLAGLYARECFVAGTKIAMWDGSEKAIELVAAGDVVLSYNLMTGKTEAQTIAYVKSDWHTGEGKVRPWRGGGDEPGE
jgi:hypothetical protein